MLERSPSLLLQPYVRSLWASSRPASQIGRQEVTFPGLDSYIVIRLDGSSLRLKKDECHSASLGQALVSGLQTQGFERELNCSAAVGAVVKPGALPVLIHHRASELTDRHVSIAEFWGLQKFRRLVERLLESANLESRLRIFEEFLAGVISHKLLPHPVVGAALPKLGCGTVISELAASSGFSHRHFNHLFASSVGVSPKHYQRLLRFSVCLSSLNSHPERNWSDVALASGYADQSHFNRDFRALAGITPTEYAHGVRRSWMHMQR